MRDYFTGTMLKLGGGQGGEVTTCDLHGVNIASFESRTISVTRGAR
jgi:hypothetical protein